MFFIIRDIRDAFFDGVEGLNAITIEEVLAEVKQMEDIDSAFSLDIFYRWFINKDVKRINLLENDVKYMIRVEYAKYLLHYHLDQYLLSENEVLLLSTLAKRNDYKGKIFIKLFSKVSVFLDRHYIATDNRIFHPDDTYKRIFKRLSYNFSTGYDNLLRDHITKKYKDLFNFLHKINPKFSLEEFLLMNEKISNQLEQNIDVYRFTINDYLETIGIKNINNINWTIEGYHLGNLDILTETFCDMNLTKDRDFNFYYSLINYFHLYKESEMINGIVDIILLNFIKSHGITEKMDKPLVFYSNKHRVLLAKAMVNDVFELNGINDDVKSLVIYPIFKNGYESFAQLGKSIFQSFIHSIFGDDSLAFFNLFDNPDTIIRDYEVYENRTRYEQSTRTYYDILKAYWRKSINSESLLLLEPNFYDDVYAKERFYVTIGVLKHLDKQVEKILFDSLTQLFQLISYRYQLKLNDTFFIDDRSEKEQYLIKLVNRYGINPTNTDDYFASVIDNEVATVEQMDRFPILEQIGDAIYELCVSELLLRDLNIEDSYQFTTKRNELVKAPTQVEIAEKIGLDNCYIHNKFLDEKIKLDYFEKVISDSSDIDTHYDKKTYLADALEMVIGSIYLDQGIKVAVQFATVILVENNEYLRKLSEIVIPSHENRFNLDWEEYELYTRRYPQLNVFYSGKYVVHESLGHSLSKLYSIIVYGNDTKQKRGELREISYRKEVTITRNVNSNTMLAYHYLNEGFDKAKIVYENEILPLIIKDVHFEK